MIKSILRNLLNFAVPNICICCENTLEAGTKFICDDCRSKLEGFDSKFFSYEFTDYCLSLYKFVEKTEIQTVIHAFKYQQMKSIGNLFGREIGLKIVSWNKGKFDYIIPVPLHKTKRRERTYNQSNYICYGINEFLNIEIIENCLKRTRYTKSQADLNAYQRRENVKNAFQLNPEYKDKIIGKNIILVDDLITTGSTITECAKVLKTENCGNIMVCSIAHTG